MKEFSDSDLLFVLGDGDEAGSAPEVIAPFDSQSTISKLKPMERLVLGRAYCIVGRMSECKREEEAAFHLEPKLSNGKSEHALGLTLLAVKDVAGAVDHLHREYELDPQNRTYRMDYERVSGQTQKP